jgi:predicted alpha/beta hydrolase family esterase
MKQVVVIHGGMVFEKNKRHLSRLIRFDLESLFRKAWETSLPAVLGEEYQVLAPRMPNSLNAKYAEWRICFKKLLEKVDDGVILVGHSLGGLFLAKYLATEHMPKKVKATLLVAPVYDEDNEGIVGDFVLPESLALMHEQAGSIHIFHSADDSIVPIANLEKYRAALPDMQAHLFKHRGHFLMEKFPEIVELLRTL